jgi:hypothetical protein
MVVVADGLQSAQCANRSRNTRRGEQQASLPT